MNQIYSNEYGRSISSEGRRIIRQNRAKIRKRKIRKFFAIIFSMTFSFLLISGAIMFAYIKLAMSPEEQKNVATLIGNSVNNIEIDFTGFKRDRLTVLLIGVDKEGLRTDVMMIGTINKTSNEADLISVPRDTRITVPGDIAKKIRGSGAWLPADNRIKLNELNAYCSKIDNSIEILRDYLEDMLNIQIDYYAKIDTEAFATVIDELGGIDYNVKERMYYNDPTQNLLIDLKPGMQHLNGKQAEGLVRFRKYTMADLHRVEIQQDFLKVAFEQIMNKVSVDKLPGLAAKLYRYIETDFKITGIPEAIGIATKIKSTSIASHTMPGRPQTINVGGLDVSYYICDTAATEDLVNSIWYAEKYSKEREAIKWEEY